MSQTDQKSGWLATFFAKLKSGLRGSLQVKMALWTGAIMVVVAVVLVGYSAITARRAAIDAAEKDALSVAASQARQIRADAEIPLDAARTLAQAFTAIKNPSTDLSLSRDQVNAMLKQVLIENPSFLGTYTLWEPNAFDGLDSEYSGTETHDETGRFIPYWTRNTDGSISVSALANYEDPELGNWYVLPRSTKTEYALAPIIYPIEGVDTVMASFVVPVVYNNRFYGIAGVDEPIAFVQEIVDSVNLYDGAANAVLMTSSGTLIGVRNRPELVNRPASDVYPDFSALQTRIEAGETFVSYSPDGQYVRVFAPVDLGRTGYRWSFGLIIPLSVITAQATRSVLLQVGIGAALLLAGLFLLWYLSGQIVRPVRVLTSVADSIAQGNLDVTADVQTQDETGVLANVFNLMIAQIKNLFGTLEQRVADRTRGLELAADVGRSVSQVRQLDVMLHDAAELIRERFNLYYTQVYLLSATKDALLLEAGTGTVGEELVRREHRLPLTTASINGRAVIEKRSVVIANTEASATFHPNPLLPDTRSEMAVPLLVGETVVGVLDMQSAQAGALNEEALPAFEALAGQLAVAIQNANLLAETERARAEVEAQARRLVRANWKDYLDAIHKPENLGFVYEGDNVTPITEVVDAPAPSGDETLISAPIALAGETLGTLTVETNAKARTDQNMELVDIVARQVAQQIENLRLLDSAERYRFEAEEASRRLTREGWKGYMESNPDANLGYLYNLNEVQPYQVQDEHPVGESAVAFPLKVRDENIGKLIVKDLETDDPEAAELVKQVAERLAAHIETLRQFDQTQVALTQSEKLFEASRSLTGATDLQELTASAVKLLDIEEINRAILTTFSYDASGNVDSMDVAANWWNGTGHEITPVGTHYGRDILRVLPMFISSSPVFFDDAFTDERVDPKTMEVVERLNLRSVAVLPLHVGNQQLGALILEGEAPHGFTNEETRLFIALAPQIATILENRIQFQHAQKQAERESMLNAISQKIQSATSVESVLQIAARELGRALGAPMTVAQLGLKDRGEA